MRKKPDDPGLLSQFQIQRVSKVRRSKSPEAVSQRERPMKGIWDVRRSLVEKQ
jgi:hypothetical protein